MDLFNNPKADSLMKISFGLFILAENFSGRSFFNNSPYYFINYLLWFISISSIIWGIFNLIRYKDRSILPNKILGYSEIIISTIWTWALIRTQALVTLEYISIYSLIATLIGFVIALYTGIILITKK